MSYDIKHSFDDKIQELADLVLSTYTDDPVADSMDTFSQPDQQIVIEIINKLLRLMYPGFLRKGTTKSHSTKHNLTALVEDVAFQLKDQIVIVLTDPNNVTPAARDEVERRAQELTVEFFKRLPKVRAMLKTDLQAFYDGDPAAYSLGEVIIAYPGLLAISVNRLAHELWELKVPLMPRMMTEYAHSKTGIDIHPGATIGRYFFIDHGTGIVVGETTVIGDNVKLYQGVTLGALSTRGGQSLRGKRRHPTIENNVTIYAGASILGGDTVVGHDSVIGSNVFITASVAPGSRVSIRNQELDIREGHFVNNKASDTFLQAPAAWKE